MILWYLSALVSAASAAVPVPVLHDGSSAARAVVAAQEATGRAEAQLRARSLDDLLSGSPPMLSSGTVTVCTQAGRTGADLDALHKQLASHRLGFQFEAAGAAIEDFGRWMACLDDTAEPEALAAIWMEGAFSAGLAGDPGLSREMMVQALSIWPELEWDNERDPVDLAPLFIDALQTSAKADDVQVGLVPTLAGGLAVDGAAMPSSAVGFAVKPGVHLLRLDGVSGPTALVIDVDTDATLTLPDQLTTAALAAVLDGSARPLASVLAARYESGTLVLAVVDGEVYEHTVGMEGWAPATRSGALEEHRPSGSGGISTPLRWGGLVTTVAGGTLAGVSYAQGMAARVDFDGAAIGTTERDDARTGYEGATRRLVVGYALVGVGAATLGTSILISGDRAWRVAPTVLPGGGGIAFQLRAL